MQQKPLEVFWRKLVYFVAPVILRVITENFFKISFYILQKNIFCDGKPLIFATF
jgi:hypothetical protein